MWKQRFSPKSPIALSQCIILLLIFFIGELVTMNACLAKEENQEFNSLRLPFGDPKTRLDMAKVTLNAIYSAREGHDIDSDIFFRELGKTDIILIGESHTSDQHHQVQKRIIEGLTERGFKVVLGLEMFNPSQNQALADFIQGSIKEDDFMDKIGWFKSWSHNWRYYQPIFAYSRDHRIPMTGINIPHELVTKVRKSGLESLSEDERRQIPTPDTTNAEHRYFVNAMMQGIGAQAPEIFTGMYMSQCLWDAAMGEGAMMAAQKYPGAKIVVLAGTGHVAYNLGIARIIGNRSSFRTTTIIPVDIPGQENETSKSADDKTKNSKRQFSVHLGPASEKSDIPNSIISRGVADFFIGVTEEKFEKYPTLGLSLKDSSKGMEISIIFPETLAEKKGFKMGDLILQVNGNSFANTVELKKWMTFLDWEDQIDFLILRDNKNIHVKFRLSPEPSETD
ncbi:MAG: ChaN family lipoprotein [Candidatus Riflebacteria bacterium]|nr:ChaN family lipoprotein [Candidatus Riflebacteria bacterium]